MTKAKVAVLKTSPGSVLEDYGRLAELAGMSDVLDKGARTILKDNISWHFLYPGANTTPWQLEGTIRALQGSGYNDLVCVQNDTVVTDAFMGEELNRYAGVLERFKIPVLYNFLEGDIQWDIYSPKSKMLVLDKIYPEGITIPREFAGTNIVHLPTVKTHIYTTTTGAMKNAFGGLLNRKRHYTHSCIHQTLVDLLRIQQEIHSGIFAMVDGTTCGSGPGPRTMVPVEADLIIAGADQVAVDAVSSRLMGFDPLKIDYIRIAHEQGLGRGDPREIEVVGEDVSRINLNFPVGDNLASRIGDLFWFSPLKVFQRVLFHTPLVYLFVFGSYFYHDKLWYPYKGKPVVRRWLEESKWGKLFQQY